MDGLIKVALIKSAKFDYTEVNVDGNSLFIGANGAGKTTLLRAILYFYTGSSSGLGISSSKKISFSEYYFEYENSYIVYIYKKDDKYVLVTVYKDSGVKFRFTLCNMLPNIKDIYIEHNKPKERAKLFLTLKELGVTSSAINSGVKYKEILYSRNNSLRRYSLFEAREYDGFVKTLSNIFINSKVDSDIIKKVIVSSLNIQSSIDLSTTKRYLSSFNGYFEDIDSYTKQIHTIKKIVQKIEEYEQTKSLLQDDLSTLLNSKQIVQKETKELVWSIEALDVKNKEIESKIEYIYSLYTKRKDKLNQKKGSLDGDIKKATEKKLYYEKEDILEKQKAYENLSLEEDKLVNIHTKKEFLTKEFSTIEQEQTYISQKIENRYSENKNRYTQKLYEVKEELSKKLYILKDKEQKEIQDIDLFYTQKILEQKESQSEIKSQIQEYKHIIETYKKEQFLFKEQDKLSLYTQNQREIQTKVRDSKEKIERLDSQLTHLTTLYDRDVEYGESRYKQKKELLTNKIEKLQKLLYPKENTLISHIYKHSKQSEKYLYYLKESILNSDIDIKFLEEDKNKQNILELSFLDEKIPQNKEQKELESLTKEYEKVEKNYVKELEALEKKFETEQKRIYTQKKQLNSSIKENEIVLITLKTKIANLQVLEEKEKEYFILSNKKKIDELYVSIEQSSQDLEIQKIEETEHTSKKENHHKKIKSKYTKEHNALQEEYNTYIKDINNILQELLATKKEDLKEQKRVYHQKLKQNNVDVEVLQNLEKEEYKQKLRIEEIRGYQNILILYKNDKSEYIDNLPSQKNELRALKEEIIILNNSYEQEKAQLEDKRKDIYLKKHKDTQVLQQNNQLLEKVEDFEKSATFNDCLSWGVEYIASNDSEDIDIVLARVDNLASRYRTYYSSIEKSLSKLHNIFENSLNIQRELDSLQTAYKLKEFYENNKIENVKSLLSENLNQILSTIIKEYDTLLNAQGKIESLIKKITKTFAEIKIGVIDTLSLRYSATNNKIIETFAAIKIANEENSFSYSADSLFGSENDSKQIIELLKKLVDFIEYENVNKIEFEDSFILEFRVVENGNDSKYVQSLDMVGSNGTDVLVKSMIYVAMLHIFKEKISKKEIMFQVVLDEVGILSQRYLKELIEFANNKGILFVNGAPDEKLIGTYKRVSLISKINKISVVKELISK